MIYTGDLTFDPDEPSKNLKITNRIAAVRFKRSLNEHLAQKHDISTALRDVAK